MWGGCPHTPLVLIWNKADGDIRPTLVTRYFSLFTYWRKRLAVRELQRMIECQKPDIIHVKGRIITEALPVLPSDRTIYQHALMGTRDPSWSDAEAEAFSVFLNRIARVLVQGKRIAETFAEAFNIRRPIDVVFTMAPDERVPLAHVHPAVIRYSLSVIGNTNNQELITNNPAENSKTPLRFGILCRFTEQKGIPYILEALKLYKERHGAVDFTFAGQGPLEDLIREYVKREKLDEGESEQKIAKDAEEEGGEKTIDQREKTIDHRPQAIGHRLEAEKNNVLGSLSVGRVSPPALHAGERTNGLNVAFSGAPHVPQAGGDTRPTTRRESQCSEYDVSSLTPVSPSGIRIVRVESAARILAELDVFVHPGLDDAMPVSIVEALMCGVPCIVSDVGASPELVRDGVEGLVIPPASAEAILTAMERFAALSQPELAVYKQRARRRYEEACRPDVVGVKIASLYREIMQQASEERAKCRDACGADVPIRLKAP